MKTNKAKTQSRKLEKNFLLILLLLFIAVVAAGWISAWKLRDTISANNSVINVDVGAVVEVEKMRNVADSQIADGRAFFLLGSTKLFDEQKRAKQILSESLAKFEKQYNLPQVQSLTKRIESLQQQLQEYFDQAMDFRAKQTESKIVGQFYQSKAGPIRDQMNKSFDEIALVHQAELNRARAQAESAAANAQVQIPKGMTWFTGALGILFASLALLVINMLRERSRHIAERTRLYEEAKKAVNAKDEVIVAVSQDLSEPLGVILQAADIIQTSDDPQTINNGAELIKSSVVLTEGLIKDILDQTNSDTGNMTLRLEQLPIDTVLDDARLMLQPLAKQRDIRLEFNSPNPPALAFIDRGRVMRVLSNLVGNAIKFSPKHSKVIVKVRSDQQFVHISVKDSGPGIPEKFHAEIFDHFWQERKTADQGSGIGLAIVKTIIEAHGGTVSLESHVGHGSTFTFSLPRRRPAGAHIGRPMVSPVTYNTRPSPRAELRDGPTH